MKRLCLLPLLLVLCSCAANNEAYYQQAQLYLGSEEYAAAADMFALLGEYADAADYALYCQGLAALAEGELALAQADMTLVAPFKSSQRYQRYIAARQQEAAGDLSQALETYTAMGSFADCQARAAALAEEIPRQQMSHAASLMRAGRWAPAATLLEPLNTQESRSLLEECYSQLQQIAYQQAEQLYRNGQYQEAMAAFESLGDSAMVRLCRSAMYAQLEEAYATASMGNAQELMEGYAEMEDYFASPLRLETLQERFGVNLLLAHSEQPYVRFAGRLWQVRHVAGSLALLTALEDGPLTLTAAEEAAVIAYDSTHLTLHLDRYAFTQGSGTMAEPYE